MVDKPQRKASADETTIVAGVDVGWKGKSQAYRTMNSRFQSKIFRTYSRTKAVDDLN